MEHTLESWVFSVSGGHVKVESSLQMLRQSTAAFSQCSSLAEAVETIKAMVATKIE